MLWSARGNAPPAPRGSRRGLHRAGGIDAGWMRGHGPLGNAVPGLLVTVLDGPGGAPVCGATVIVTDGGTRKRSPRLCRATLVTTPGRPNVRASTRYEATFEGRTATTPNVRVGSDECHVTTQTIQLVLPAAASAASPVRTASHPGTRSYNRAMAGRGRMLAGILRNGGGGVRVRTQAGHGPRRRLGRRRRGGHRRGRSRRRHRHPGRRTGARGHALPDHRARRLASGVCSRRAASGRGRLRGPRARHRRLGVAAFVRGARRRGAVGGRLARRDARGDDWERRRLAPVAYR